MPAGGFTRLDVRVPNERDNASTTKVEVQFPPGFTTVSTEPVPGWTITVKRTKLAESQVNDEGEKVTDRVDTITWTGDGNQGAIGPGQFHDFGLSVATPDKAGASLTFKALQTYDNGDVVRWIGAPDSDEPAPQVKLTAAASGGRTSCWDERQRHPAAELQRHERGHRRADLASRVRTGARRPRPTRGRERPHDLAPTRSRLTRACR